MTIKLTKHHNIDDGIYQGGYPHTGVDDNITAILSLVKIQNTPIPETIKTHITMEIDDGPAPPLTWLTEAITHIETMRKNNHQILIHCYEGISRSVLVTAAYLIKYHHHKGHNWTHHDALEWIAAFNPKIDPAPAFIKLLNTWTHHIKGTSTRTLHNYNVHEDQKVRLQLIRTLHKRTNAPKLECRNALNVTNWNIIEAAKLINQPK